MKSKKNKCRCGNEKYIASRRCRECFTAKKGKSSHTSTWGRRTSKGEVKMNKESKRIQEIMNSPSILPKVRKEIQQTKDEVAEINNHSEYMLNKLLR